VPAVSQQDIENARVGYTLMNEAYRRHDVEVMRPHLEKFCHPSVLFEPAGILPESTGTRHGVDGMLDFMAEQMKAFADGSMSMTALDFIEAGDRLVVPYRFGGRARYTGLDVEFQFVHVYTMRDGLLTRLEVHPDMAAALEASGWSAPAST
jgi:ketosteroid isomerase-like protein